MKIVLLWALNLLAVFADDLTSQEITNANNLLSASIFKTVFKSSTKNFLLSPISTQTILALLQSGSKGETAEEIRTALHLPNSKEEIEDGFKTLLPSLTGNGLHIATKMYVRKKTAIRPNFKKVAKQIFKSEFESVDFSKRAKAARSMNQWVRKNTKRKIQNLVAPSLLNPRTKLILLNALLFKANFSNPFPVSTTRKNQFFTNLTNSFFVDMMFQKDAHFYNVCENLELKAKFLEVPFKREASMVIALPSTNDGLGNLQTQIGKVLEACPFTQESVVLGLPKFRVETRVHLKNILKKLGLSKVFSGNQADLSGISGKKGNLVLSEVLQKVFFEVAEGGVQVAASTDTGVAATALSSAEFIADHPFIFFVKIQNIIAFVGRVIDPRL